MERVEHLSELKTKVVKALGNCARESKVLRDNLEQIEARLTAAQEIAAQERECIVNPEGLILGPKDSNILGYPCDFWDKCSKSWAPALLVGYSFASSQPYKVKRLSWSPNAYVWTDNVKIKKEDYLRIHEYNTKSLTTWVKELEDTHDDMLDVLAECPLFRAEMEARR